MDSLEHGAEVPKHSPHTAQILSTDNGKAQSAQYIRGRLNFNILQPESIQQSKTISATKTNKRFYNLLGYYNNMNLILKDWQTRVLIEYPLMQLALGIFDVLPSSF